MTEFIGGLILLFLALGILIVLKWTSGGVRK